MTSHKISFVSKIGIILKATSDDESPTPGYLYKEINDISFESIGYCESLVEFLEDRLRSKSCHVKFKVLKVMKHLTENGSREFQLCLRKRSDVIKECTKFGGPPHPMHGNIPYLMVRKIAKELCEILYSMEQPGARLQADSIGLDKPPEPKYGGLGPVHTGRSNQGFGNTPPQPKTLGETIWDGIEKLGAKMSEKPSDRQAAMLAKLDLSSSTINYRPPVVIAGNEEPMFDSPVSEESRNTSFTSSRKQVKKHQPGRAGGGWGDDDEDDHEEVDNENNNDNGSRQLSFETDSLADQVNRPQGEDIQADWKEESELVTDVLKQGSTGKECVFLSPSTISEFVTKCCTLSCDKVVEILAQKLINQDASVVLRSLQLLEGIIYNNEELVAIDHLTSMCKEALISCFLNSDAKHQTSTPGDSSAHIHLLLNEQQKTEPEREKSWLPSAVQVKSAKVILILQQLSSQKEIIAPSRFKNCLFSSSPPSDLNGELAASS
uniref:ENTH domain-containing protein n=1 Tax=Arion vulgaris TaxID=1028688 RepID=A0A0B6ZRF0_9EUPU